MKVKMRTKRENHEVEGIRKPEPKDKEESAMHRKRGRAPVMV